MAFTVRKRTAYGLLGCSAAAGGLFAVVLGAGGIGAVLFPAWAWQQSVRTALSTLTSGEADFSSVSLHDDGAQLFGLTITHPNGTEVLRVERIDVVCEPVTLTTSDWHLTEVALHGVFVRLDEAGDGLALPPATWDLVWGDGSSEGAPRVQIDRLVFEGLTFEGRGQKGVLAGTSARGEATDLRIDVEAERPVVIARATIEEVASTVEGRELVDLARLELGDDGVFAATGVEGSVALQVSGWPVWPPLVELWIPTWAGGRAVPAPGEPEPWWGWEPATWVWVPDHGTAEGRVVLTDRFMASRPATWVLSNTKASIGPADKRIPWTVTAYTAGAPVRSRGHIASDGRITGHVSADDLEAKAFDPYLSVNLHKFGVEIREGKLDAEVDWVLRGSALAVTGPVSLYNVRFTRTSAFSGLNKALLTTASWLAGGNDKTFTTEVDVRGDFADPRFSPFRQIFGDVSSAMVKDAGDRVGKGASTVKETAGKLWDKVFK
ncbi:MAG: DUF748 domain-containing protein [Myxococcota bacterium]